MDEGISFLPAGAGHSEERQTLPGEGEFPNSKMTAEHSLNFLQKAAKRLSYRQNSVSAPPG